MTGGIDWEDAMVNGAYIKGAESYPPKWAALAEAFRSTAKGEEIAYGEAPRQKMDLFWPEGAPKGLIVIVHGGYWLAFDKSSWSHLAAGALALGWAVAMPSYTLAPQATIPKITAEIGKAVSLAAEKVAGPIRLTGHSAGGHLVTRMISDTGPLTAEISERIERVVSISGVHDLRPLLHHSMNEKLNLTEDSAAAESPALRAPLPGIDVTAWVGARERPEFLRQSALLAEAWDCPLVADPDRHHFDVIDGLIDPDHPLCQRLAG